MRPRQSTIRDVAPHGGRIARDGFALSQQDPDPACGDRGSDRARVQGSGLSAQPAGPAAEHRKLWADRAGHPGKSPTRSSLPLPPPPRMRRGRLVIRCSSPARTVTQTLNLPISTVSTVVTSTGSSSSRNASMTVVSPGGLPAGGTSFSSTRTCRTPMSRASSLKTNRASSRRRIC